MARKDGQKLKLLCILEILNESTDINHGLTLDEVTSKLTAYGIEAERKSIYRDFDCLNSIGYHITKNENG